MNPLQNLGWGDGEYRLVNSIPLDRDALQNHVWKFDPTDLYQIECAKWITAIH